MGIKKITSVSIIDSIAVRQQRIIAFVIHIDSNLSKAENGAPVRCPVSLAGGLSPNPLMRFLESGSTPCRCFLTHDKESPFAVSVSGHINIRSDKWISPKIVAYE